MKLSKQQIKEALIHWNASWDNHDLDGVMALFHEDILFENWTGGKARGKDALRKAWAPWFKNHGGFRFIPEDTLSMKLNRRFFIAGSSNGRLLKKAMKADPKFEEVWMSSIFKTEKSSKS